MAPKHFKVGAYSVYAYEVPGLGLGSSAWAGSLVLSHFLQSEASSNHIHAHPVPIRGVQALELGAGVGVPGIMLAAFGAKKVVLTERDDLPALELLRRNVDENTRLASRLVVCALDWEAPAERSIRRVCKSLAGDLPELLIASDVVYSPDTARSFVRTLAAFLHASTSSAHGPEQARPHRVGVVSYTQRSSDSHAAFMTGLQDYALCIVRRECEHGIEETAAKMRVSRDGQQWQQQHVVLVIVRAQHSTDSGTVCCTNWS
eukprot:CAMPEP_0119325962 /NCGR_PEP_ID=MMETSP1333-20130426/67138_1 /TAXON_ID=418940 /ORGANISM="Scyphosphaera apsteinii, Strain RCC1455" /LENGTH=259 /DNA_ID=CAMNT_0007334121 /DNA_START=61 /DNA_END=840 /DNA_ORIENTATION=-